MLGVLFTIDPLEMIKGIWTGMVICFKLIPWQIWLVLFLMVLIKIGLPYLIRKRKNKKIQGFSK